MRSSLFDARFAHHLNAPLLDSPTAVVDHFGCMQSQDFHMAKWAIGRRCRDATESTVDAAFADAAFLRTHILRPTWHFVTARDLPWITAATAPRVLQLLARRQRQLGLTEARLSKATDTIVTALGGGTSLTRNQIGEVLREAGIETDRSRLAHVVMHAELSALICNGAISGKQQTYRLLPAGNPRLSRDEAHARLAHMYVRGHGPTRPEDLAWWTSLTLTDCRRAFELAELQPCSIDGESFWTTSGGVYEGAPPVVALISAFDESISYVRKPIDSDAFKGALPNLAGPGGLLFIDGLIRGKWRRKLKTKSVTIDVQFEGRQTRAFTRGIEEEAYKYAAFVERELELTTVDQ